MDRIQEIHLDKNQKRWKKKAMETLQAYQQGVLYLATGIGKSYIAKSIINDYLKKDETASILWISHANAMNNIKNSFFDNQGELYKNILFISFENIRANKFNIDDYELNNLKLIVIDEAHRALAEKTWNGLKEILNKYTDRSDVSSFKRSSKKADLLVMSASDERDCDNKETFKILANRLIPGRDYEEISLQEAIDQSLYNKIHFLNNNTYKYKLMLDILLERVNQCNDSALTDKKNKIQSLIDNLQNYIDNMAVYLGEDIRKKVTTIYNGSGGDQWMVFYNTVEKVDKNIGFIEELFKNIYKDNEAVKINVYKYHNKVTAKENEQTLLKINSLPGANNVNIYVTCMKGTESIHPKNVVGEIQFRATHSINLYEQIIGRVTESKAHSSRPVFVIDIAGNSENIKEEKNKRKIIDKITEVENINNDDNRILNNLKNKYVSSIDIAELNSDIESIIREYNTVANFDYIDEWTNKLAELFKNVIGDSYTIKTDYNPFVAIQEYFKETPDIGVEYAKALREIQSNLISGACGEYIIHRETEADLMARLIINRLGVLAFFDNDMIKCKELNAKDIMAMCSSYMLCENIWRNTKFAKILHKIREMFLRETLPESIIAMLKYFDINIAYNEGLIDVAYEITVVNDNILKEYKKLVRLLRRAEDGENIDYLTEAYAYYIDKKTRYYNMFIMKAIDCTFKCLDKAKDIDVSNRCLDWCKALRELDGGKRTFISSSDKSVFKLAYAMRNKQTFSDVELYVLRIYDVKPRNKAIVQEVDKLMQRTSLYNIINKLETCDIDEQARSRQIEYLKECLLCSLPEEWKRKVESIVSEIDSSKTVQINTETMEKDCSNELSRLEYSDITVKELNKTIKICKKYIESGLKTSMLIALCFDYSYKDCICEMIEHIKEGIDTEEAIETIDYIIEDDIDKNYIKKLVPLLKENLISEDYRYIAMNFIKKHSQTYVDNI